jgi:hypothetical protein
MRCPKCGHILSDEEIKRAGATLMGRASGESKRRSKAQAKGAARARWEQDKSFSALRTLAGVPAPKKRKS